MSAKGIRCFGKVQGVFFRASAKSEAENLGLTGWVRNEKDGTVLIYAEGEAEQLRKFCKWCEQGSEFASVSEVKVWDEEVKGLKTFEIRRD